MTFHEISEIIPSTSPLSTNFEKNVIFYHVLVMYQL